MTQIRINKGNAFTVTAYYVPTNESGIVSHARAAFNRKEAFALARESAALRHCSLVLIHDDSGALQGFAPGSASVDLFDADSGSIMHVPVYLSDTLPRLWDAIVAHDAASGK